MTLTFLDLYNDAASQDWSMYDNEASGTDELEKPLIIALNKAVSEILYSYPFSFRERTHILFTVPKRNTYDLPKGLILKDKFNNYSIKLNSRILKHINEPLLIDEKIGIPEGFYIKGAKLVLYPVPSERFIVSVDYLTLSIGENKSGDEIYTLSDDEDTISVPAHLEEIFKNAVISRAMLKSIASEQDENYSAYKKQSEMFYRQLVKYSKGVWLEKSVKI